MDIKKPPANLAGGPKLILQLVAGGVLLAQAGLGGGTGVEIPVCHQAGACGDQLTDQDVLLQTDQVVDLAWMAASVRTLVVSWKEAADRKESGA